MSVKEFSREISINAPRVKVWAALTGADIMAQWVTVFTGGAPVIFAGDYNAIGEVQCLAGDGSGDGMINRIVEYKAEEKMVWEHTANLIKGERQEFSGKDAEWKGLRQSFILSDEKSEVKLSLTVQFPDSYDDFSGKWREALAKIKELAEKA
ncbi:MAG: SRPBCC family protein [Gammaproteobacteria bacterium]